MASFIVLSPDITWTGTPIADSKITWQSATITETAATGSYLTSAAKTRRVEGLKTWNFTINGFYGTPHISSALNVAMTGGYSTNIESWSLNWNAEPKLEYTTADSNNYMSCKLGAESWSGSYTAKIDDDEPLVSPGASPASLVLTSSSGNTLTGDAIITSVSPGLTIGEYGVANFSFEGDDTLAVVGSNNIASAVDPLTRLAASTITIKGHEVGTTDVQYSGSAVLTGIQVSHNTNGMGTYTITGTGSGALTIADPAV